MDPVDSGHADSCDPLARREALGELRHTLHERVKAGRTDRLDEAVALAACKVEVEMMRDDERERERGLGHVVCEDLFLFLLSITGSGSVADVKSHLFALTSLAALRIDFLLVCRGGDRSGWRSPSLPASFFGLSGPDAEGTPPIALD